MRNKITLLALCLLFLLSITAPVFAAEEIAVKSSQPIYVNNAFVDMTAYNIGGNNYVRLRDIGQTVNFDLYYDDFSGTIHILTNVPYTGEQSSIGQTPETVEVTVSALKVFVNGQVNYLEAYNIGGNNFVKLREVGLLVNFGVEWDAANNRVLVKALRPYMAEPGLSYGTTEEPETPARTIEEMKAEIVRLTNEERVKAGLPKLEVLPELMDCAQAKAQDFFDSHYYGHNSPVYGTPGEMMRAFIPNSKGWGENIAPWMENLKDVFDGWMNSPEHRDNILDSRFTHIGIGIVPGANGGYWWVMQLTKM